MKNLSQHGKQQENHGTKKLISTSNVSRATDSQKIRKFFLKFFPKFFTIIFENIFEIILKVNWWTNRSPMDRLGRKIQLFGITWRWLFLLSRSLRWLENEKAWPDLFRNISNIFRVEDRGIETQKRLIFWNDEKSRICVSVPTLRQNSAVEINQINVKFKEDHVMLTDSGQFIGNILLTKDSVSNSKMNVMQTIRNVNLDTIHHFR